MKCTWQEGNRITLLENGDNFYPAVFEAISHAQQKVFLETFIWKTTWAGSCTAHCCMPPVAV